MPALGDPSIGQLSVFQDNGGVQLVILGGGPIPRGKAPQPEGGARLVPVRCLGLQPVALARAAAAPVLLQQLQQHPGSVIDSDAELAVIRARFMTGGGYRLLASANLLRLVLCCIDNSDGESRLIFQHFSR